MLVMDVDVDVEPDQAYVPVRDELCN